MYIYIVYVYIHNIRIYIYIYAHRYIEVYTNNITCDIHVLSDSELELRPEAAVWIGCNHQKPS